MTAEWATVEHLPTRKRMVVFDGRNGAEIAWLVGDDDKCVWDGYELVLKNSQAWFTAKPGERILFEPDGSDLYPIPEHRFTEQYRVVDDA